MKFEIINTINRYNALYEQSEEIRSNLMKLISGEELTLTKESFCGGKVLYITEVGSVGKLQEAFSNIVINDGEEVIVHLLANNYITEKELESILGIIPKGMRNAVYMSISKKYKRGVFAIALFVKLNGRIHLAVCGEKKNEDTDI